MNQEFSTQKKYKMPSGLGGVFSLRFIRMEGDKWVFRITNPDFEKEIFLTSETVKKVEYDGN